MLEAYRLLVEAASAGANVTALAIIFNSALEGGGRLGPEFRELALRLAEEARRASLISALVAAAIAAAVIAAVFLLLRYRRAVIGALWLKVWEGGLLRPGSGKPRTILFDEEALALIAAVVVVAAALTVALALRPAASEPFSAIGLLGPEGKIGGYPSEVRAGERVKLHVYVHNHMGAPAWFIVYIKVANSTREPPLPERPALQMQRLLLHNETWIKPFWIALNGTGKQRVVAELWIVYTNGTVAYTGRYVQLWVSVVRWRRGLR
jgi:uncharacterized membrane protein